MTFLYIVPTSSIAEQTDSMASKCVHKGCGKEFTDPEEDCLYHPGPPVFHEGQKGKSKDLGGGLRADQTYAIEKKAIDK